MSILPNNISLVTGLVMLRLHSLVSDRRPLDVAQDFKTRHESLESLNG
jgi:hypothetical protein